MFKTTVTPHFSSIDGLRHINNHVTLHWFELGRNDIYKLFNPKLDYNAWNLILVHLEIDYKQQMYYGSDAEIRTWISKIGNSSFEVSHEAWQNDKLCAAGKVVIVHFDFNTQKSTPIPEEIRSRLEQAFED